MGRIDRRSGAFGLKQLLPAALIDAIRQNRNVKTYRTWDEAVAAAHVSYDDGLLTNFRIARVRENLEQCERSEVLMLCLEVLGANARVTDFGGSTGEFGRAAVTVCPSVEYRVVECPGIVERMNALQNRIVFETAMPDTCDVFFTSCTLPYLDNPMEILRQGLRSARRFCIVARNCFAEREVFRVQTSNLFDNGPGRVPAGFQNVKVRYPHRTTVEADVIAIAKAEGFHLAARFEDDSGVVPYRGLTYGGTLVFGRSVSV